MSSRITLVWALTAALAGCGVLGTDAPPNTPQAQCEASAYDDPTVKELQRKRLATDQAFHQDLPEYQDALADATRRCLQSRGIVRPGGVEREQKAR